MDFVYGPDQQRWYTELLSGDTITRSTVYVGNYEKITEDGTAREFYYLDGNTIAVRENGVTRYYLAFTDHLGSILSMTDEDGNRGFDVSCDAWGEQTVAMPPIVKKTALCTLISVFMLTFAVD